VNERCGLPLMVMANDGESIRLRSGVGSDLTPLPPGKIVRDVLTAVSPSDPPDVIRRRGRQRGWGVISCACAGSSAHNPGGPRFHSHALVSRRRVLWPVECPQEKRSRRSRTGDPPTIKGIDEADI